MRHESTHLAKTYYTAMAAKDLTVIEKHVDENVHFIGPFAEFSGKQKYLSVTKNFMAELEKLEIRTVMGSDNQAVVIYDVFFPNPIGKVKGAAILDLKVNKVTKIELIYDTQPMEKKADDIFMKND